jgi:hypothetical protein
MWTTYPLPPLVGLGGGCVRTGWHVEVWVRSSPLEIVLKIWPVVNGLARDPHDLTWHDR